MATKLQQMRLSRNLTQAELAQKTGLNLRTLQYYEQGNKPIESARLDKLLKLCIVLKCKISDIIDNPRSDYLYTEYEKGAE
jgi:DNA-binding Xre family transcriptional regulator